eukprot:CAMPEP_0194326758 /NCGR_PEP_ID=MMETSP0171-20130528/38174_1 /TAXON_ID=218684 /ORGANISM="Corethron pennatum, Strain L29A3" /LENGTH=382 /DNA_ID=CAMNT_0039086463 /DNA_START=9 /DNA_END=1154 /DNA_ORIENTATION=-
MASTRAVYIIAAKRTPFGSFGGSLKNTSATELAAEATRSALSSLPPGTVGAPDVDQIYVGNVVQTGSDAAYLARHVGLMCGTPVASPALTLNRLCGSGFETVVQGADAIRLGRADVAVCAGTENMSSAPFVADGNSVRWGATLGSALQLEDSLWAGLTDKLAGTPMGVTAENLAEKYGITRNECDEYAVRSQKAWAEAKLGGRFDLEMAPVEVKGKKGATVTIDTDEHPRIVDPEKLAKLKPVFKKDGVVTAANASGICDGAGSIILASEETVLKHNLTPLARVASYFTVGCDPTIMGIGPAPAIRGAVDIAGIHVCDADRVEINEAFAAQYLACEKELRLDRNKTNINGGAISIGHPLGASGSRILAHLANEYGRTEGNRW